MMRVIPVLLLAAGALSAQGVDRTKEPATPPVPDFKLPAIHESKLSNGLRVVLVEDSRFPLVSARLNFHAGTKCDPADLPGLATNTALLLVEGTQTRSSRQIAETMDSIGGSVHGTANGDSVTVFGDALAESLEKLLDVVADVARNATFPEDEVQLRKQQAKQMLASRRAQPSFLAEEKLYRTVFGPHPYARYSSTPESIEKLDRKAVAAYRDTWLLPNNATLIVLGQIPRRDATLKMVEKYFGGWAKKEVPAAPKGEIPAPRRQILLVDRPGSVQADIHVGRLAPVRSASEYYPLMVGSVILGGGASSRMFTIIREKEGFAYDAHSEYETRREAGMAKAVTQVRNDVVEPALKALLEQLDRMGSERVTAGELTSAKNLVGGMYLIRFETQEGLATNLTTMDTLGLPNEFLEKANRNVRNVEPDQLQAAAKKYFGGGDSTIVVVGDAAKIGETLKKFGEVTVTKAE
jgi:predicted Zn-dependent peptidase